MGDYSGGLGAKMKGDIFSFRRRQASSLVGQQGLSHYQHGGIITDLVVEVDHLSQKGDLY